MQVNKEWQKSNGTCFDDDLGFEISCILAKMFTLIKSKIFFSVVIFGAIIFVLAIFVERLGGNLTQV